MKQETEITQYKTPALLRLIYYLFGLGLISFVGFGFGGYLLIKIEEEVMTAFQSGFVFVAWIVTSLAVLIYTDYIGNKSKKKNQKEANK